MIGNEGIAAACVVVSDMPDAAANWTAAANAVSLPRPSIISAIEAPGAMPASHRPHVLVVELSDAAASPGTVSDQIDRWMDRAGSTVILSFPRGMIDAVFSAQPNTAILLCDPTQTDRIVALSEAISSVAPHVAEADSIAKVIRLQQLADEVGRIARALAQGDSFDSSSTSRVVADAGLGYRPPPPASSALQSDVKPEDIRAILRFRRERETMFGAELFADPAWDMILDLAAARLERVDVAISSLCIAAAVPPTTALRWIRTLTDLSIFVRHADVRDGRRIFVALAEPVALKVSQFLARAKGFGAMPI